MVVDNDHRLSIMELDGCLHRPRRKELPMEISLTVKQIRGMLGLTQEEFANKLEIKLSTYVKKENGTSEWSAKELFRISDISQIPPTKIII